MEGEEERKEEEKKEEEGDKWEKTIGYEKKI